jgi:L-fucose isomerase-like protein
VSRFGWALQYVVLHCDDIPKSSFNSVEFTTGGYMSQPFGIISMHPSSLLDADELETITGGYFGALGALGGKRLPGGPSATDGEPLFLLVATGGSEEVILKWWENRTGTSAGEPLFLIAHPGNNSLPAALEVLARLQQDGAPGRIFYLKGPDDAAGLREISDAVHDFSVKRALRQARIGLVGAPSNWLVASSPDAATIRAVWGPTIVPIEMDEVVQFLDTITDAELAPHVDALVAGAIEVREPSTSDLREVGRVYLALKRIVTTHRLEALTVRCFDLVLNQRTTGCFALAQLTDDGVIAGCEGDLVSTIGLMWAHQLLGATPWMANPAQLDPQSNTLWLAHCTVPRTVVERYRLRSHFESGLGVGIQGTLAPGPVTLLRIGGAGMDRLWLAEGEILRSGNAENLCRTQVEIQLTNGGNVTDLLRAPLGNHLVVVSGHHLNRLRRWHEGQTTHEKMATEGN